MKVDLTKQEIATIQNIIVLELGEMEITLPELKDNDITKKIFQNRIVICNGLLEKLKDVQDD